MKTDWFVSRGLDILNYQVEAVDKVIESLEKNRVTILAAAPGAGKTLMTIHCLEEYFHKHPGHKAMVLTHGTTLLRTQFHTVLEETRPDFSYNLAEAYLDYDNKKDLNVCLPHTLEIKGGTQMLNKIDLLIVDEAHQFYNATMVQNIIRKTHAKKQLLLTGTPSRFIRDGLTIIPVTLSTIFDEGRVSDLSVEVASSSYDFDWYKDFTDENELPKAAKFRRIDTEKTLDDLLTKLTKKLKGIMGGDYQNLLGWLPTLKKLQKTMIACHSQAQARQVQDYFNRNGVLSALSISDDDANSEEIQKFIKEDSDRLVLLVVGRGILGFNFPPLVNLVDMTLSHNIDRVYQLMCRVIRKHPEGRKKLFFKIAPSINSDYYKFIMTAVLAMTDESFYCKYNGKNLNGMEIYVRDTHNERGNGGSSLAPEEKESRSGSQKIRYAPIDFPELDSLRFFEDLYHKKDDILHTFARGTVKKALIELKAQYTDMKPPGYWTFEKCVEDAQKYKTRTEWKISKGGGYNIASYKGWLPECTAHMEKILMPSGYWTLEKCKERAMKYNTSSDWQKNDKAAYMAAFKNKWINECQAHMTTKRRPRGYWTKEKCLTSALKYKTPLEWRKNESGALSYARKNGWLVECQAHMTKATSAGYWTKEKCLKSAVQFKTYTDWHKNDNAAVCAARKNGWYGECIKHMKRLQKENGYWNKEKCKESALKYSNKKEWEEHDRRASAAARRHGWFPECTAHMTRKVNIYWTLGKCKKSAARYNTPSEWQKSEKGAYLSAFRKDWIRECTKHMIRRVHWTPELLKVSAAKYGTLSEWRKNEGGAYTTARKDKALYAECTAHMTKKNTQKQ